MNNIRVAAGALNQTPLDFEGNTARILAAVREAQAHEISLLCLPELAITGYGVEDAFFARDTEQRAWAALERIADASRGLILAVGLPVRAFGALYNAVALIVNGELVGLVPKQNLASDGVHYEARWFKPWPAGEVGRVATPLGEVPIGDLLFDLGGVRLGFEVCEDAWVADRPGVALARRGVDLVLNPSASHFSFGKSEVRERFVTEGSRAFQAVYLYASLLGNESGRILYDGETLIASDGRVIARGPRFSYRDLVLTEAVCDVEENRLARLRSVSYRPGFAERATGEVVVRFSWPQVRPTARRAEAGARHLFPDRNQEFAQAVALGLFDYLRKSRSRGFVLSLSGGVDSSAVAALVALMVHFGVEELGPEGFRGRLAHMPGVARAEDERALMAGLLTCIYQRTVNNSEATLAAARAVAEGLGARFFLWDLDEAVALYRGLAESVTGPLGWERDDLALQNLQARTRVPALWLVANAMGALLLTTSNRSEVAVGYATMDGDTAGGLAPLAGVEKSFLTAWLKWLAQEGHGIAFPALAKVVALTPSAELRPGDRPQADEEDLMPYPVLDAIEREAIVNKRSPLEVYTQMQADFGDRHSPADLRLWVARFFRLWTRNQWKRERFAPGFHVDNQNLDPRSWCRFPILSGGYEAQLLELERGA